MSPENISLFTAAAQQRHSVPTSEPRAIKPNSLLEALYTHQTLNDLYTMLGAVPNPEILSTWRVNANEYRAAVSEAIEWVKND